SFKKRLSFAGEKRSIKPILYRRGADSPPCLI
ncbi:hypothetical protein CPC197_1009B, partial [Chlamydia psittaci C1/97]